MAQCTGKGSYHEFFSCYHLALKISWMKIVANTKGRLRTDAYITSQFMTRSGGEIRPNAVPEGCTNFGF